MNAEPLVTVIVPGFDVAPYVPDALASLRAQTLTRWTAILVDDGSRDETGALFAAAAAADDRFQVISQAQQGLSAARNIALAEVRTPYTAFLDADDVLVPDALERLVGVIDASGSDFVVGAYVRLRPAASGGYLPGEVQPWVATSTVPERIGTTLEEHPEATANVVAWSKLSRTDFWARTGLRFPAGVLYEDQIVAQQMYTRARAFDVVPDVVVQWRVRAEQSSITQHEERLDVLHACLEAMDAGLRVLETAGQSRAAQARAAQIQRMDVPRLAAIARAHPDAAYRRALGVFTRDVRRRGPRDPGLSADAAAAVSAALLW